MLNDESAPLTGKRNPITAGKHILDLGPTFALIKKGEHARSSCTATVAALPAYPTEVVIDPTGGATVSPAA